MKPLISIIFLVVLLLHDVSGQDYYFRKYANEEGLHHTYVYAVNQDIDGFIWIGTPEGLYKFNGYVFEYFTTEDGLADNFVLELYRDHEGILWMGHQNGSITRLSENGFEVLNGSPGVSGAVTDITEDEHGSIWVSVQNQGLLLIDRHQNLTPVPCTIEGESLSQIACLREDHFLIGTQENLYLAEYSGESETMQVVKRIESGVRSKTVEIVQKSNTDYIIVSQENGFFSLHIDTAAPDFECTIQDENADGGLDNLQGGILDGGGSLWLYSMGNGIIKYQQDDQERFLRTEYILKRNGLASDNVRSLMEDAEGNLWLGMYGEGLLRFNEKNLRFYCYNEEDESNPTSAIINYDNNLLLASGQQLLMINQTGDKVLANYPLPVKSTGDKVNALYRTDDGRVWLGLEESGLYVSESTGLKFNSVFLSKDELANSINHITEDQEYLWVGTKKGICRIHKVKGNNTWFTSENGLPHNNIRQLFIDSKDRVIIATPCRKVYYINDQTEVTQLENGDLGQQYHLSSIQEDSDGNLWMGTEGNGVWKINPNELVNYTAASGLYSNFCYNLVLNGEGAPMIGHRGGISLIGLDSKRINTFSSLEGISSSTVFFPNAVLLDELGYIWFGTSAGLVRYSTEPSKGENIAPRLYLEALYINGERKDLDANLITLKPGQYDIMVDYIGLHFSNPEMVVYQTQLSGYNTAWSAHTARRTVLYERIGHGHYTFHIRAFNQNDVGSEIGAAFELRVKKPVYLSIWFYGIIVFLMGISFYLILRIRERNHRQEQKRLLQKLDEKTKEIIVKEEIIKERKKVEKVLIEAKTKAELSEKLKTSFLQNMSHEIRTPMNAIVGFSQLLKEDELASADRDAFIENISSNAATLLQLIDNILDLSRLESNHLEINMAPILVNPIMDELESKFLQRLQIMEKDQIKFQKICQGEEKFELYTDGTRLKQILTNLLDNAVKFTDRGKITFGYSVEETRVIFHVEDTGIGLSEDKKEVIFDLFRKVEEDRYRLYGGTGLGLTLAKHLVTLMGGEIQVDSKQDFGSRFYFHLPRNNKQQYSDELNHQHDEN